MATNSLLVPAAERTSYLPPSNPCLHVLSHPLYQHQLAHLRLVETDARAFRQRTRAAATVLCVEATRDLDVQAVRGQGPLATFEGDTVKERIGVVPILRAGLGLVDACLDLLPDDTSVLHIGLFREKKSLQPVEYYSKLPATPTVDRVLIVDPLVATGGTAIACVQMIQDWGIPANKIKFLCLLGSEQGIKALLEACPGVEIWCGHIDKTLDKEGLMIPGLGDAGDRLFATLANH
ncbi:hypothetical protein CF327_g6315 [Tilletia walkeri]|uniref:uracil phosphoribosyltransferase n=1 Tax=Tilletia walkeri TaxID=117179 RepID=A0A8X7N7R1_9BASI|nr:hypothetical protein CF327_g6315 [Tilletia walkeri]KAE8268747.1 hypothetical protein A4X09_0g3597 [Tilletia walkeri]